MCNKNYAFLRKAYTCYLLLLVMTFTGLEIDPGFSGLPINESATLNPLCLPQQLLGRTAVCCSPPGSGWTVYHKLSTKAPILNLCKMSHYQLKGSVSLYPPTTTRRSPTMGANHDIIILVTIIIIIIIVSKLSNTIIRTTYYNFCRRNKA